MLGLVAKPSAPPDVLCSYGDFARDTGLATGIITGRIDYTISAFSIEPRGVSIEDMPFAARFMNRDSRVSTASRAVSITFIIAASAMPYRRFVTSRRYFLRHRRAPGQLSRRELPRCWRLFRGGAGDYGRQNI